MGMKDTLSPYLGAILICMTLLLAATPASAADLHVNSLSTDVEDVDDKEEAPTQKTVITPEGSTLVIDEAKGTVSLDGVESPVIVDELVYPEEWQGETVILEDTATKAPPGFVYKSYFDPAGNVSLDVFIEESFYWANQAALDDFWDKFYPRFVIMKDLTGWSSKRLFGVPLEIYVYGHSAACYGGNASPTHANVVFSDPMYKTGCHKPYYENGSTYYNNPGELGDWWPYMNTALHEALHSIMPYPIYTRSWLTEGWSEYYMYNVLTETVPGNSIPDINQETADTYLYNGFAGYQWDPYVANDYHDTTIHNRELQRSHGYDITGHMFSKMRDEEGLDWDQFYLLLNNNKESLDRTFSLGPPYIYYTDAFIVNVFGRAMGHTDYYAETDPLFNYYGGGGADGHGYGARNISHSGSTPPMPYADFDWFGDLTSTLSFSDETPQPDENFTITATVSNDGDVNLKNISVRLYDNGSLIYEEYLDINKYQSKDVVYEHSCPEGEHTIEARVDEDEIKIELDDENNDASQTLTVTNAPTPPVLDPVGDQTVDELQELSIQLSATDINDDTLYYYVQPGIGDLDANTGLFTWTPTIFDHGTIDVLFWVTDGRFTDSEEVTITVNNVPGPLQLSPFANITRNEMSTVYVTPRASEPGTFDYAINSSWFSWNDTYQRFSWKTGPTSAGEFDFLINVSSGSEFDEQPVHVTVNNKCTYFDKRNWCWVGCTCWHIYEQAAEAQTAYY